jgi:hypothetical protein
MQTISSFFGWIAQSMEDSLIARVISCESSVFIKLKNMTSEILQNLFRYLSYGIE